MLIEIRLIYRKFFDSDSSADLAVVERLTVSNESSGVSSVARERLSKTAATDNTGKIMLSHYGSSFVQGGSESRQRCYWQVEHRIRSVSVQQTVVTWRRPQAP